MQHCKLFISDVFHDMSLAVSFSLRVSRFSRSPLHVGFVVDGVALEALSASTLEGRFTHSMPFPCRAHAVPLPCRAAKGLECVFPI